MFSWLELQAVCIRQNIFEAISPRRPACLIRLGDKRSQALSPQNQPQTRANTQTWNKFWMEYNILAVHKGLRDEVRLHGEFSMKAETFWLLDVYLAFYNLSLLFTIYYTASLGGELSFRPPLWLVSRYCDFVSELNMMNCLCILRYWILLKLWCNYLLFPWALPSDSEHSMFYPHSLIGCNSSTL